MMTCGSTSLIKPVRSGLLLLGTSWLSDPTSKNIQRISDDDYDETSRFLLNTAASPSNHLTTVEPQTFKVVMETRKRVLGAEHPDTLTSMANLALTYGNQGRWKEAEELEVQVMETCKRVLGTEHPHTLISMNNLASTYRSQGRWKEAEELEVVSSWQKSLLPCQLSMYNLRQVMVASWSSS